MREETTVNETNDDVMTPTVETEPTPPSDTAAATETDQTNVEPTPPAENDTAKATPVSPKLSPSYVNFFEQYVEIAKENKFNDDAKAARAIKALNNSIKEMLKVGNATAFNSILNISKKYKDVLTIEKALQGIATLARGDRAIVETTTTVFRMINNPNGTMNKSLNLETVRSVIKNEAFVNWCAKKIG